MVKDNRSKRALAIDRLKKAKKTHPNTAAGREKWRKNKAHSDLKGHDTFSKEQFIQSARRFRRVKGLAETTDNDLFDFKAFTDSSLSKSENKTNIRRIERDFMR